MGFYGGGTKGEEKRDYASDTFSVIRYFCFFVIQGRGGYLGS